jgi:cyclic pyranopterin phosphate synthase
LPRLIDPYNRHLNYLRISVTDRCNLDCIYCTPQGDIPKLHHDDILRYEEILRLVNIAVDLGIAKVRVTGGEPLVRKGIYQFLNNLANVDGLHEVTLTTNGVNLKGNVAKIWSAGIRRINVSLDSLNRVKYQAITGRDLFDQVWQGLMAALKTGFSPIKLNVVTLRDVNLNELVDFARLSLSYPFHVRFIEHMPIGQSRTPSSAPLHTPEIKERIQSIQELVPVSRESMDGPAERYRFAGAPGEIGFISALSHHFCGSCNRLRLTAAGQLRPCLLSDKQLDLKGLLRAGASNAELADVFIGAVKYKPSDHHVSDKDQTGVSCQMSAIGG